MLWSNSTWNLRIIYSILKLLNNRLSLMLLHTVANFNQLQSKLFLMYIWTQLFAYVCYVIHDAIIQIAISFPIIKIITDVNGMHKLMLNSQFSYTACAYVCMLNDAIVNWKQLQNNQNYYWCEWYLIYLDHFLSKIWTCKESIWQLPIEVFYSLSL